MSSGEVDIERFSRQISLPDFGVEGQKRLSNASVLLVGVGGLGSPIALYLAAAGVGRIGIVDADVVSLSNLQRQVLFRTADLGLKKVDLACERLETKVTKVVPYFCYLDDRNSDRLASEYDVLIGATDNQQSRFALSDAAVRVRKPFVHGSVFQYEGQVSVFYSPEGPCYRCLHPGGSEVVATQASTPPGVLGAVPGIVGCVQALETIKWIVRGDSNRSCLESLVGKLWMIDGATMETRTLEVKRRPGCSCH